MCVCRGGGGGVQSAKISMNILENIHNYCLLSFPPETGIWEASNWLELLTSGVSATTAAVSCTSLLSSWVRVTGSILLGENESTNLSFLAGIPYGVVGIMNLSVVSLWPTGLDRS